MKRSVVVDIHSLLNPTAGVDLTVYEPQSGDKETPAGISVADWKEALLAINVLSRRIDGLLRDVERVEKQVDNLRRDAAEYHE